MNSLPNPHTIRPFRCVLRPQQVRFPRVCLLPPCLRLKPVTVLFNMNIYIYELNLNVKHSEDLVFNTGYLFRLISHWMRKLSGKVLMRNWESKVDPKFKWWYEVCKELCRNKNLQVSTFECLCPQSQNALSLSFLTEYCTEIGLILKILRTKNIVKVCDAWNHSNFSCSKLWVKK